MTASDQIASDLERLAAPRTMTTTQRQEVALRVIRMRSAEARNAKNEADAKQNALRRAIGQQVELARDFFHGDTPVEVEEALREIIRLVG